jgi:hypothetical protein
MLTIPRFGPVPIALAALTGLTPRLSLAQPIEKQLVVSITQQEIDNGVVTQLAWDGGVLVLQGVVALPNGQLSDKYYVAPADGVQLKQLSGPTRQMLEYWQRKSRRVSPTGLGEVTVASDSRVPMTSPGGLEQTMSQASDMGGMHVRHSLKIGRLVIFERAGDPPYDGQIYSWSPPLLNRVAYTDAKGDLWVARADGRDATRLLKGNYTLPAWSDDGRVIAIAERQDGGKRWDVSVVHVPERHRK